jgi:hypothetical protein
MSATSRLALTVVAAFVMAAPLLAQGLLPPVRLEAGGEPIDTDVGHAAPGVVDFDGDGKRDLLVGQFGGGKLKIFRNVGTEAKPRYDGFVWFEAGGAVATVPAG